MKKMLDSYRLKIKADSFVKVVKKHHLCIYNLKIKDDYVIFDAYIWHQRKLISLFEKLEIINRARIRLYLQYLFHPSTIIIMIISVLFWYACASFCYEIKIHGAYVKHHEVIKQKLGLSFPVAKKQLGQIKEKSKEILKNDINWLEIDWEGCKLHLYYSPKALGAKQERYVNGLYAQRDGVIAYYEVSDGFKKYRVGDVVHKGDLLVGGMDENDTTTKVKGKVYAYQWKDIKIVMKDSKMPKAWTIFEGLLEARREVSKDFKIGDKIHSENILQFYHKQGKIIMVIHYVLIQDITSP